MDRNQLLTIVAICLTAIAMTTIIKAPPQMYEILGGVSVLGIVLGWLLID